jgi:tetratricopeptide (TPR) repeat protein
MNGRRVLVIGSQCDKLNTLSFLPEVAVRLHALLTSPGPGECLGAMVGNPTGLLVDATVSETKAAIRTAIESASKAQETLILAYIGHGDFPDERSGDFYLMPKDATEPTMDGAIYFAEFIKDRIKLQPTSGGLVVLLDTCHAGVGAWQSMERWAQSLRGNIGFALLTATDDRTTADAPLARAAIDFLEHGDPEAAGRIRCDDLYRRLREQKRRAQLVTYNPNDDRHFLARNIARDPGDVFWKDSDGCAQILKQTEYFQPTPQLAALVEASWANPVVVLTGEAGAGKSTLAAALVRPELTGGLVPGNFVQAIAVLGPTTNQRSLAADLERQLRRSVAGFAEAVAEFQRSIPLPERERLGFLQQKVLGPLDHLAGKPVVRIVLDGFNQLPDVTRPAVGEAFAAPPAHLRLVKTTRTDTSECPLGQSLTCDRTSRAILDRYLSGRRIPEAARGAILERAQQQWLVARLLADAVRANPNIDLAALPSSVDQTYATLLDQAGAAEDWNSRFRPVFGLLAVAGSGPVLPLGLLAFASKDLGGPDDEQAIRDVLVALCGLVVRRDVGTRDEQVGLFHPTLAGYLLGPAALAAGYGVGAREAHRAMTTAIEALAPAASRMPDDPVHRYAFVREADHLIAIDDFDRALASLRTRVSNTPRENLERLRLALAQFRDRFGASHPSVFNLRGAVATWTGRSGDAREAVRLFTELLPEQEHALGPDHPDTLTIRSNIAFATGDAGDAREAQRLLTALLPARERVLGRDHADTLTTRGNIAAFGGEAGHAREALRLFTELLPDQERALGRDHIDTLATRKSIAAWTAEVGEWQRALELFRSLLQDQERVLGRDHPELLSTRSSLASCIGGTGDAREALRLFTALLPEHERVLGRDHPETLTTRRVIAWWTGKLGDAQEAIRLAVELLPDLARVRGTDHPHVLVTRSNIAVWIGQGNAREALRLAVELLSDQERVLGREHPDALTTRGNIATWTGTLGQWQEALRLFQSLLRDQEQLLGRDHPYMLWTRANIAACTGAIGHAREALRLFTEVLPDRERVLGRDHPDTLTTRANIADWTSRLDYGREALRLFTEVLADQERVLGRDHPNTLNTLGFVGGWAVSNGDRAEGCRRLREGLARSQARYGTDDPSTRRFQELLRACCGEPGPAAPVTPGTQ